MPKRVLEVLGLLVVLIAAAIAGGFGKFIGQSIVGSSKQNPQQIEEQLTKGFTAAAKQINQRGPTMVDENTRLDRASVGPGARATYHYSFPNSSSRDVDASVLQATLPPTVKRKVCSNKDMRPSLLLGATYVYSYEGNDGIEIARFEVNQSDCALSGTSP